MPSEKMAKRSAAFNACVQLHKNGEFNDNLMPINSKRCLDAVGDLYFKHWEQYGDGMCKFFFWFIEIKRFKCLHFKILDPLPGIS